MIHSLFRKRRENENNNICTLVKEEGINGDSLHIREIPNSGIKENNTDVDDIDIVCHKIEIDK